MRFERLRPKNDEERILPLINIVFLLLIFFMLFTVKFFKAV